MVAVIAESGRSKSGQFAIMAVQSLLFCEARWSCSQTYPQKMGAEFFHARADILQLIEIVELSNFPTGSHNWEADWRNFSGASQENNMPSGSWSDEKDNGRRQRCREKEIEYVDRLVAGAAGISGCIVGA